MWSHSLSANRKKNIVSFIKYVSSKTGKNIDLTEEQIADAPTVDQVLTHVQDNTIVTNLNLDLRDNASYLYKVEDVIHYSDIIERVIVLYFDEKSKESASILQKLFDYKMEISLIIQCKTGEKYVYITSKENAAKLLNSSLGQAILIVKWADYDILHDKIYWLPDTRSPNLVVFNHHWQLSSFFKEYLKKNNTVVLKHCDIGFENMPFRTLITHIDTKTPLLTLNVLIGKQVSEILQVIKNNSKVSTVEIIQKYRREINSHFILWSGWDYRADWTEILQINT